ncbi:MAG TPA: TonB-dependent receptor [Candidatus Bacteroides merdipullorum]|uniref:TonB-dependent receptor n=1 Tax=Candidatus Bacteroides merdipullorum TaxID=2838474 RepID=A0A9D2CWM5_9BACE|nr:TonB-dependent receptor [Candidatus Bacteroides merdipullorum]
MKQIERVLLSLLLLLMAGLPVLADENVNETKQGAIRGRIIDNAQQTLPGATIYIESLHTGAISDVNGFYTLANLAAGTYRVKVSYVGYSPAEFTITVPEGKTVERDVTLNEGIELQEVVVGGAFTGQRRALSSQKNAMGISNVVSADQVGKFPDSNIGDALKRISGINVQYDQGEARFGQVRGTSADLSSVTINGNRIPSAEGDTRNVQLDLIPADMVQTIEVSKVVTADMDGDAIGGSVNLVTKNTPYRRIFNATAGSGYNAVSKKAQVNLGLTYGDRFLNDKLGLMISGSYQYAPGGSDNAEFEYDVDDDQVVLKEAQVRQYYVTRERQSYSLALDYEFNADHKISFKGMYNRRNDWENRYRAVYKDLDESDPTEQSIELQTKGGANDTKNARLERQQTMDFTLDGEHNLGGRVLMDWAASFSRASEDRPNERYFGLKMDNNTGSNLLSTFHGVGGRTPYSTLAFPALNDEAWELDELTNSDQSIYENEWKFRLNFEMPLAKGLFGNTLRFGGKYTNKTKDRETEWYKYDEAFDDNDAWRNNGAAQIRSGFMVGDFYPEGTHFVSKEYLGSINFGSMEGEPDNEEMSGNYHANEQITSAYLRFDQKLGRKLNLMLGLRMEHTALDYRGLNWVVDEEEEESLAPTGNRKNNYTNWLPSVLLKYDVNDDFKLRASFTETLSRPKYAALIPSVNYNSADEEATIGNPDLKPTTSYNFDLSAEYYFKSVGLVSLGFFYKSINDVIVDEVWQGMSPEIPISGDYKYEISKPINAYDANLYGVEVAYQRDFSFIAPALKCLGFYGNYTYTANKTKNHHFEHRVLEEGEEIDMIGSPEHTANASLFFEKWGFNLRLSYNFASAFVDEMGEVAELDSYYDKVNYLDLNATYTFGKRFKTTIYADVTNLLNQPLRYYQGTKDRTMQVEYYGARFNAGIKVSF